MEKEEQVSIPKPSSILWYGGGFIIGILIFIVVAASGSIVTSSQSFQGILAGLGLLAMLATWFFVLFKDRFPNKRDAAYLLINKLSALTEKRTSNSQSSSQTSFLNSSERLMAGMFGCLFLVVLAGGGCIYIFSHFAPSAEELAKKQAQEEKERTEELAADRRANPKYYTLVDKWGNPPTSSDIHSQLLLNGFHNIDFKSWSESNKYTSNGWLLCASYTCNECFGVASQCFTFRKGRVVKVENW